MVGKALQQVMDYRSRLLLEIEVIALEQADVRGVARQIGPVLGLIMADFLISASQQHVDGGGQGLEPFRAPGLDGLVVAAQGGQKQRP